MSSSTAPAAQSSLGADPALADLGSRLRQLSGDAAYQAGLAYFRKGVVKDGSIAGRAAYATVRGSTDYRVSVAFGAPPGGGGEGHGQGDGQGDGQGGTVKVSCTCPAHRRNRYCKHVVAVCTALLQAPEQFVTGGPAPPEVQRGGAAAGARTRAPRAPRSGPAARPGGQRAAEGTEGRRAGARPPQEETLRAAGLETVERLLTDLADGGLMRLGAEQLAILAGAADLVRGLKLRRLGNLLMTLQRAAQPARPAAGAPRPGAGELSPAAGSGLDPTTFATLLADLCLTYQATATHLRRQTLPGVPDTPATPESPETPAGPAAPLEPAPPELDPQAAEDLLGKTWRDEELEPVPRLELLEVAWRQQDDGEFRIETSYLVDLPTARLYQETQITPSRLAGALKPRHRLRLLVEDAALYPGPAPRRVKLRRVQRAPLRAGDLQRLLAQAPDSVAALRAQLVARGTTPFGPPEVPVIFRPAAIVAQGEQVGAVDHEGDFVALEGAPGWLDTPSLPTAGLATTGLATPLRQDASGGDGLLCGLLSLAETGLRLRCLAAFCLPADGAPSRAPAGAPSGDAGDLPDVAARVRNAEVHLERLLAAGWRNAGAELPALAEDAVALAEAGAGVTASRLRHVVDASGAPVPGGAQTALPAVSLALAACRQLRARLPGGTPPGTWTSPVPHPARRGQAPSPTGPHPRSVRASTTRLLPLARLALEDGEAWACARLRNGWPAEWILVDPPPPPSPSATAPSTTFDPPRWLGAVLDGHLQWRARYPLGADGDVERFALLAPPAPVEDSPLLSGLEGFRRLLSRNGLKDGGAIGGGGDLRFRRLDHAAADAYRWPDRVSRDLFAGAGKGQVWALAWSGRQENAPVDPLAILVPGRLLRRAALMHLVPGLPTTPF